MQVESALREWADGYRRLQSHARDRARYERLHAHVDAVIAELRRRVGETFTLAELAAAYGDAERWTREAVDEVDEAPGSQTTVAMVEDAAFHLYARGAVDYRP